MSAGTTLSSDFLASYLNNVADAQNLVGAGTATTLYVSLHTGTLTATSSQSTSEAAYTGYARQSITRSSSSPAWTVSGQNASNANQISFPACTGGTETETYVGIGTAATGAGVLLMFGALSQSLAVSSGITPAFASGALTASLT